tara:strand:+ start:612 stop:1031 length:420 start_codon:yes stop_codon:yes gene_type:complete
MKLKIKNTDKGLWLFGLSGTGKTFLSKRIFKNKKRSFIIDGDIVRDLISFDLGYKKSDRIKQNKRVLGIAKMVIKNGYYPIISSVYLDPKIAENAKKNGIKIINVVTANKRVNKKLLNKKNIVGKSIKQPKINCEIINV